MPLLLSRPVIEISKTLVPVTATTVPIVPSPGSRTAENEVVDRDVLHLLAECDAGRSPQQNLLPHLSVSASIY